MVVQETSAFLAAVFLLEDAAEVGEGGLPPPKLKPTQKKKQKMTKKKKKNRTAAGRGTRGGGKPKPQTKYQFGEGYFMVYLADVLGQTEFRFKS